MADPAELVARWGERRIAFRLIREDRRTLRITVDPDGAVKAYAPCAAAAPEVVRRVARRGDWIIRQLDDFALWRPRTPARQYVSGETHLLLGRQYRLLVRPAAGTGVDLDGDRILLRMRPDATFVQRRAVLRHWYGMQARRWLPPQLDAAWPRFRNQGVERPRLIVRHLVRRWGSFSTKGALTLNAELVQASPHLIEYVVNHELAHAVHPNHGEEWRRLMKDTMTDWRARKAELEMQLL